jgi:molybdopterin-guanine dinucleotide biosynthesis protein A
MTGIVLIGGESRRFGQDKVIARIGEKRLIELVLGVIQPLFAEIILIGHKREGFEELEIVEDLIPGCGPMGGIYTALCVADSPSCFVFAADMPNLNAGLIQYMLSLAQDYDVIIPAWSKGIEPLHAIYRKNILPVLALHIRRRWLKIERFLAQVSVQRVDEETITAYGWPEVIFANINTPHDFSLISKQRSPKK